MDAESSLVAARFQRAEKTRVVGLVGALRIDPPIRILNFDLPDVRPGAAEDRRVKMLSLTRAGASLRAGIISRMSEPLPWMLALSERDQKRLRDLLRKGLRFAEQASIEDAAEKA